ncbi:MAG TPA: peptidase M20 [Lachnospiraceae bacterium]|nr:peptidase M20 [Lachnospiraceae bacterium]HIS63362.1 M20 family metallopeptidase [Candidatus Scybalomonas excrementigallinarum]
MFVINREEKRDAIFFTKQLVRLDSSNPGNYEKEIKDYIELILPKEGVVISTSEVLPNRYNLMAEIEGEIKTPAMIFICHMDTVMLGEDWTKDPLGAEEIDGKIYGRGACDMKSGLACAISVFCEIAREVKEGKKLKHSLKLICSADEEDFMRGVEKAIADGWVQKEDWIMDTEPTNGQIQVAHKGRTWFEITIDGITAHASTPWKGADANAAMAEVIREIRLSIENLKPHEDLGISTVTFGQIQGGYRPYVVPDHCTVWVDMRLVPPTDTKMAEEIVKQAIHKAEQTIVGVKGHYKITGDRPYVEKDENSYLLHQLKQCADEVTGEDTKISFFPGYTDTAVIAGTLGNRNCMSYGPGNLELAHKPDEWVAIEDIVRCEKVLKKLARTMTGQQSE